ncbi:MAG: cobalamin-binding protein [Nitrospirae bacterium]|nr:MAG: cobalamin-binding protein [Nitrospirota bacterium]
MRIVSFLPSATEIACALGLREQLVGITHECDYPETVRTLPVVVRSAIDIVDRTPEQIDHAVREALRQGQSLYVVDEALLRELEPDVILTQDLCQVCAPSGNEVGRVLAHLPRAPRIVWLRPQCLEDILCSILEVGEVVGVHDRSVALVQGLRDRIDVLRQRLARVPERPRVCCLEWVSPLYSAGHWMPELIALAGGESLCAESGKPSERIRWEDVREAAPDVLIVSPCGFDLERSVWQAGVLTRYPGWEALPAVRNRRVYAVDANSYFARPGPRVVDGAELLASLLHPDRVSWGDRPPAARKLTQADLIKLGETFEGNNSLQNDSER